MPSVKVIVFGLVLILSSTLFAAPNHYLSYKRQQKLTHTPDPSKLLRIWMIDVGQGDGLLIQLPAKPGEPKTDILIDGGAWAKSDQNNVRTFLKNLYGKSVTIEHSFITHHDSDHVKGLIEVLNDPSIEVQNMYHNGLASYLPHKKENPQKYSSKDFIFTKNSKNRVSRVMAGYDKESKEVDHKYIINSLEELSKELEVGNLHIVYRDLAKAIVNKKEPAAVNKFELFNVNSQIELAEPIELIPLWPVKPMRYKNWGYTINGNSLTFNLKYNQFSMLFTGDHNDESETALLEYLESEGKMELLEADVLKIPHHGSSHGVESFFRSEAMNAVLGIASMGDKGFGYLWKHPNTKVVRWMGGAHKVFHTFAEEKYINWYSDSPIETSEYKERTHILIETDGEWFRVVEVQRGQEGNNIPSVEEVDAGDGTRWIEATPIE